MKRPFLITVGFFCLLVPLAAQAPSQPTAPVAVEGATVFKLYPTQNMWNFLQLNTVTGQILQLQYDLDLKNQGAVPLNSKSLLSEDDAEIIGRFALYPTQNMWNFILLDQIKGYSWQVQWSLEEKNRLVLPIYTPEWALFQALLQSLSETEAASPDAEATATP